MWVRFYSIGLIDGSLKRRSMVFLQGGQEECFILKAKGRKCYKNEALTQGVE